MIFLDEVLEMIYHPKEKEKQLTIFDIIDEQRRTTKRPAE